MRQAQNLESGKGAKFIPSKVHQRTMFRHTTAEGLVQSSLPNQTTFAHICTQQKLVKPATDCHLRGRLFAHHHPLRTEAAAELVAIASLVMISRPPRNIPTAETLKSSPLKRENIPKQQKAY